MPRTGRWPTCARCKPGYAVGGLNVKGGLRVDGLEFVFMRIKEDGLDKSDSYTSPWLGGQGGGEPATFGGEGSPVVGLAGRGGSDLDAIGLVSAAMSQ